MRRITSTLLLALALGAAPALAQEGVNMEGGVAFQRKTVINFDDDTIEGDLKTPDGQYLEVRKKMRHKSLIRIRSDFRREVLGSIADL
jgi:hypothetical protein